METENTCRDLQQSFRSMTVLDTRQILHRDMVGAFYRDARATSLEPMLRQHNLYSVFGNNAYPSNLFICHSKTPDGRYGPLSPRFRKVGTIPDTQGVQQAGSTTHLQGIPRPGLDTHMQLTRIPAIIHPPSQTFRVTSWPGFQQARNLEQNPRPRIRPQPVADLLILSQLPYSLKVSGSSLTDASGQRADGNDGYGQYRGRARARDSSVGGTDYTPLQTGTRSTSNSSGAELDIIDSYGFSSEEPETRASTRPTSRALQYGCALTNEEDYVAEGLSDGEDDVWDECEMSSGDE
ncbi:MAG: hypothetical protein ALECFALPRED_001842 [Alectoria fallacina]|uniref:Uncharacterized protein n=1 Tax=Alectoria fallacina TaxID=1903189 RepID=A0A8H3FBP7_9LECA|nr:MAG: hypothetical protein ALECFALPRED_001842 [Alectoria fallacina]